jgi:DNA-binding NarL/FixJ family response regulator
MITVAIIEDNRLLREGMTDMLNGLHDVEVVCAAAGIDTELIAALRPTIILLDIGLNDASCLDVAESIRALLPDTGLIVMDLLPVDEEIAQLINAGVAGFILKDATFDDFAVTIRSVAAGAHVLPPRMTGTLFSQIARIAVARDNVEAVEAVYMTPRELEVIALIANGHSNREIAQALNVASETVKSHVRNVMDKLALHTRLQIAAYAHQKTA